MEMEDGSYLRLNYNEYYLVLIQKPTYISRNLAF